MFKHDKRLSKQVVTVFLSILFLFTAIIGVAGVQAQEDEVHVVFVKQVKGPIPSNPNDPAWKATPPATIHLLPQNVTEPMNLSPSVKQVSVRALSNKKEIAVRLEWRDAVKNTNVMASQEYRDGVAVMFPVKPTSEEPPDTPSALARFMGAEDEMMNIWHWKADWQREHGGSELDIRDEKYPNMHADYFINEIDGPPDLGAYVENNFTYLNAYPIIAGKYTSISPSGHAMGVFDSAVDQNNILAKEELRKSSVEDLNAEGFGTLTTQQSQDVDGYGVWGRESWKVVMKRSLGTKDKNDTQFTKFGKYVPIVFAVWDGDSEERDGMKAISSWHFLKLK